MHIRIIRCLSTLVSLIYIPLLTHATQTATLYRVVEDRPSNALPSEFVTISAVGVGTDGATKYVEEVQASHSVDVHITGTTAVTMTGPGGLTTETDLFGTKTTLIGATRTYHATIVADASHVLFSQVVTPTETNVGNGEVLSCAFDGKGGGSCVDKVWIVNRPSTSTYTRSYTGSTVPWYTVTVTGSLPTGKSSDGMSIVEQMAGWRIVLLGLVVGVFFGL